MKRTFRQIITDAFTLLWKDIKNAKWVIIIIIAYFALLNRFFYSTCPVVMLTGFPCPACGLTRAAYRLLAFDITGAWEMHPFLFGVLLLALVYLWNRYGRQRQAGKVIKAMGLLLLIVMAGYYVWRMVQYFPGDAPMSYYPDNLLNGIARLLAHFTGS